MIIRSLKWINAGINNYISNRPLYTLIWLISGIVLFVFWDFLTFQKLYLFHDIGSDTLNASLPKFYHISQYLREYGVPGWSFNQGMGQNIYPFSIGDPFNFILYLFGAPYLVFVIAYVEILKIFIGGIFFFLYLKLLKMSNISSIFGGIFYSFSSYNIIGGSWLNCSTEAAHVALLLFALELFYQNKKYFILPIPFFLFGAYYSFNLYIYGIISFLYLIMRYYYNNGFQIKGLIRLIGKFIPLYLLGVLVSAVFLFPNALQYLESPRVGGDSSNFSVLASFHNLTIIDLNQLLTSIMRFFSNDLLGTGSDFKGWNNYFEAPMFYCGVLNLIFLPQLIVHSQDRIKRIFFVLFTVFSIMTLFPIFRHAFWLFTGDYFRSLSFIISIFVMIGSAIALTNILNTKINFILLIITFCVLQLLLSVHNFFPTQEYIDQRLLLIVRALVMIYVLVLIATKYLPKEVTLSIILVAVGFEIVYFTNITVNQRAASTASDFFNDKGYYDYTIDAVKYLKSNDNGFFRLEKDYSSSPAMHKSMNDGMVQDYFGTSSYDSFNQKSYINFLQDFEIIPIGSEFRSRWARGLGSRPILQSVMNVKYILSKDLKPKSLGYGYQEIATLDSIKILKNLFFTPFGSTYDRILEKEIFNKLPINQKDLATVKACIIEEDTESYFDNFTSIDDLELNQEFLVKNFKDYIKKLQSDTLVVSHFTPESIIGDISLNTRKILFLSIPFDSGWNVKVNGETRQLFLVNCGFTGLPLESGSYNIELSYQPKLLKIGFIISILSVVIYIMLILLERNKKLLNQITRRF